MESPNRQIAIALSRTTKSPLIPNSSSNYPVLAERIKWLSYEPSHNIERINHLLSKSGEDLSIEELNELLKYKNRKRMERLVKKYNARECTECEFMEVYDYLCNDSIEELMLDKLTDDEIVLAKQKIERLSELSNLELEKKVKEERKPENYDKLSMIDSYALHHISHMFFTHSEPVEDRKQYFKTLESMGIISGKIR